MLTTRQKSLNRIGHTLTAIGGATIPCLPLLCPYKQPIVNDFFKKKQWHSLQALQNRKER